MKKRISYEKLCILSNRKSRDMYYLSPEEFDNLVNDLKDAREALEKYESKKQVDKNIVYVNLTDYSDSVKHVISMEILNRASLKDYGLKGVYRVGNLLVINKKYKTIACFPECYEFSKSYNELSVDDAINGDY